MAETLAQQVARAAKELKCSVETFVKNAYVWMWGKKHGGEIAGRCAGRRCARKGTFTERTIHAVRGFISFKLAWPPVPVA